ncbi:MAG: HAMP domain-containing protein, partial [Lysobacter sp.]
MNLLRFLRIRGLFFKQVVSFFFSFVAVWLLVGFADSYLANARFKHDAQRLLDDIDFAATPGEPRASRDAAACRALADRVFWQVVERGVRQVSDFDELLAYFHDGRLHVQILSGGRVACASAPAPRPQLARAMQRNRLGGEKQTLLEGEDQWALARRVRLADGTQVAIGLNYWPGWATDTDYVIPYDLARTMLYTLSIGASFVALWMWLLLRRVRRATQAADRWAAGDFSARIVDRSRDEFSALAERFNRMADALAKAMSLEKVLGGSLERNRIARDLHDTAKQRSFVLGLKLTELEHDAHGDARLLRTIDEARALADRLQQDLIDAVSGFSAPAIAELGLREAISRNLADLLTGSPIVLDLDLPPALLARLQSQPAAAQELLMITHEAV